MFSRPPALAQQLATEIEKSIVDRRLQTGDRIATMDELREQSGYGRATIGETARLLSERGAVEVRPGRGGGLFVAAPNPVVQIRRTLLTAPQNGSTVGDAVAVREAMEELIALDAARHRTPDDIADLRLRLSAMQGAGSDWTAFMAANWSLHERIAAITPNSLASGVYLATIRAVAELPVRAQTDIDAADYLALRTAIHAELVDAIASGDLEQTRQAVDAHRGISIGSGGVFNVAKELALIERARDVLEETARVLRGQVAVAHCDGHTFTVLAAAGKARIHGVDRALIGERTSLIAPTGIWWISQAPSAAVDEWSRSIPDAQKEGILRALDRVRDDGGVTVGLASVHNRVQQFRLERLNGNASTPLQEAQALCAVVEDPMDFVASRFGDGDTVGNHPEVRSIWAPVLDGQGRAVLGVMATGFPSDQPLTDIVDTVRNLATSVSSLTD